MQAVPSVVWPKGFFGLQVAKNVSRHLHKLGAIPLLACRLGDETRGDLSAQFLKWTADLLPHLSSPQASVIDSSALASRMVGLKQRSTQDFDGLPSVAPVGRFLNFVSFRILVWWPRPNKTKPMGIHV